MSNIWIPVIHIPHVDVTKCNDPHQTHSCAVPPFHNPKLLQGQKQNINTVVDVGIVTSFLLPPPSLVADFDSTNREYDGHNKEQYSPDKPRSHSSTFYIFGKIVLKLLADGESGGRMRENTEPICLGCTHVFHWNKIMVIKMGKEVVSCVLMSA